MSVDGFPSIMIPLEQQARVNPSVQSMWPKKQASSPETELLNFQTAELHLLLEAICALNPSLHISKTAYNSPINCHSPRHDVYVDDSCGPSSDHTYLRPDNSVTQHLNLCSSDLHPLPMARVQSPGCGFGHSWEPTPLTPKCCSPTSKPSSPPSDAIATPSDTNLSTSTPRPSANAPLPKTESSPESKGRLPLKLHSTYWPKKIRSKKTWLLQNKTRKTLDTIPENQEWIIQNRYQQDILTNLLSDNSEPKSVFENDSDSEDGDD
ncbi:hypothetical protein PTTG_07588 [Puccinia triticina 1-1 BBBD Race 1]|uniref:Uncharacterized protein n=2 Tax=Puccinia triticina TaxID=208348 RepID=A0A180GD00_PUCT1|nr:uncharacterized protein PtA15_5A824 [Puccinia triticina]OAV90409.1 hypothetical protein PTTG_07588 [Puccinia triticina 1-1 BBBD Race 1]WAQ85250.1 hypothetical protein PtA15_5A824 [Puccinia triticina]